MPAERHPKTDKRRTPYNDPGTANVFLRGSKAVHVEGPLVERYRVEESKLESPENNEQVTYPPKEFSEYFACPFVKHRCSRYHHINNACTNRWGFETIGRLDEHIQRIHSLEFVCLICKTRFQKANRKNIESIKASHNCMPREFTTNGPEWMTEEQEGRLATWDEHANKEESGSDRWGRIYGCIFPGGAVMPTPFYDFLVPRSLLPDDASKANPPQNTTQPNMHPQLQSLAENEKQFDYGFDFAVYRGTDSGYHSRETHGNEQEPDACHISEHPSGSIGLSSHDQNVVPNVDENDLFNIGESYPAYVEDHDLSLPEFGSAYFDEAMPGPALQDQHSQNESEV